MYFFRDLSLKFVSKSIVSHAGHIFLHADPLPGRAQYLGQKEQLLVPVTAQISPVNCAK
jgi:hypothetical protein